MGPERKFSQLNVLSDLCFPMHVREQKLFISGILSIWQAEIGEADNIQITKFFVCAIFAIISKHFCS